MGLNQNYRSGSASSDSLDAHFIEQMIPHHEDAVTMAKLAETRAKTPVVKKLAKNIISTQKAEIDLMQSWYWNWFGKKPSKGDEVMTQHGMTESSEMHMGIMGNDTDMTRLTGAADFDRVFVEDMIPHHQMAGYDGKYA